ncbi:MAG: hypothetical protein D6776_01780, partial [Planctomycetota bacterium]
MRTTKRIGRGAAGVCAFLLALAPALASAQVQVTGFRPECGTPGDLLLIEGQGFPTTTTPTVTIAGTRARLLRNGPNRILCRVAPGTPTGSATVEVDGVAAPGRYTVLPPGSPVILRQSTRNAAPGQWVVLVGLRFGRHPAVTIGGISAQVRGRWRVVAAQVPNGVTGTVDVVVTNAAGQSNAACPGSLTVVPAGGSPTITNVTPSAAAPGDRITIEGQYLAPAGLVRIAWDDGAGTVLQARGISNGYDKVYSYVPPRASAGSWTVTVFTRPAPASTSYTVGTAAAPQINALRPDTGPAGTRFAILGNNLLVWGSRPDVTFDGQS